MQFGIDEVGRGALAGAFCVGAAACDDIVTLIRDLEKVLKRKPGDSKQLTALQRERGAEFLMSRVQWGFGLVSAAEVDALGLTAASRLGVERALEKQTVTHLLADQGLATPAEFTTEWMVKGDERVPQIMCASIIAKVLRDRLMTNLAEEYPHYGWERNKGYGSRAHIAAIREHGLSPEHRRSFVRAIVQA